MPKSKSGNGLLPYQVKGSVALYMNGQLTRIKNFRDRLQRKTIMDEWTQEIHRLRNHDHRYELLVQLNED